MSSALFKNKKDFVNEFSLKFEEIGHSRIFGQILGWLLICEPRQQSFNDLMENLEISKASVSNITRILLEIGLIEKVRISGERQMYFKVKTDALSEFMDRQVKYIQEVKEILEKGYQYVLQEEQEDVVRLKRASQLYAFLSEEIPILIDKFNKNNE